MSFSSQLLGFNLRMLGDPENDSCFLNLKLSNWIILANKTSHFFRSPCFICQITEIGTVISIKILTETPLPPGYFPLSNFVKDAFLGKIIVVHTFCITLAHFSHFLINVFPSKKTLNFGRKKAFSEILPF